MTFVTGGTYTPGDQKAQVTVADFCMDVTEVTVAAYATRATAPTTADWGGATAEQKKNASQFCNGNRSDRRNHPVNCVNWKAAVEYCEGLGHRLPTGEEWEWAARGGERGSTYPWGDSAPGSQVCWDGQGSDLGKGNRYSTCEVGSFPAGDSPLGIKDLAGNVWEWTASTEEIGAPPRVCPLYRGGGWDGDFSGWLRPSYRRWHDPFSRTDNLGFRCARTP
jgi:formylglycine-generating enzyme required for sulfatase activity